MSNTQLKRSIGFITATAIVIGTVIGSGIFMKPGIVIGATGDSTLALLVWVIGGIITLASGLTIAEVSAKVPETGGLYVYIEKVYGRFWGFLCGWVQTIIYGPAVIGALGLYFGTLFAGIFSLPKESELWIGIMAVLFLSVVNMLGSQFGGIVQSVLTAAKLLPIFLIIVFGVVKGNVPIFGMDSGSSQAISLGAAVLATLWAYDGWMNVGFVAGEMKNPAKTLPKAIITGILIVMFAYVAVNVALLHVLRADDIVALGPNAASEAATILFGSFGGKLIAIGILISIFGCLNGKVLTFPRMPLAMAIDGLFPLARYFSRIHPKWRTPVLATFMQITIAIIMMLLGNADRLTDIAIFSVFLFYGFAFYAVFLLRKSLPSNEQLYRVPFYPFTPIVAIVGTAYIIISTVLHAPLDTFLSIVVTISGIPVYYIVTKKRQG
ncbi:amino acid permease [Anoxybacillus sp. LAT_35]|uniref:APC family permease n=1 Tax=unclassified Anoxybacillus TaxID=2639704 RepID=UPI001ED9EF29|nr:MULTISPECIES: amino acid permease [unclassified Anoxybacillus]MCG5026386.1 amino acid permease [Anoxybacillus flavithermus]MCG6196999.1 amino acid permease [Anoxybacillus sp. LAT_38]MCG3084385.1 amino acid permease [Anoxybacillus sp. LAT27]MCG6171074.1 amino acid permease [Anoxybacillus sp. LAT_11]MCG6176106.1 amino acid permease [Anoxybacillus sp. LAT_31]